MTIRVARLAGMVLTATLLGAAAPAWCASAEDAAIARRVAHVLSETPLIDGHNDFAEQLVERFGNKLWSTDLSGAPGSPVTAMQTDLHRLHQGQLGGQFWSVWIPSSITGAEAVSAAMRNVPLANPTVAELNQ